MEPTASDIQPGQNAREYINPLPVVTAAPPENKADKGHTFSLFGIPELISAGIASVAAYIMSRTSISRRFFTNMHRPEIYNAVIGLENHYASGSREARIIREFRAIRDSRTAKVAEVIVQHGKTPGFARQLGAVHKAIENQEDKLFADLGAKTITEKFFANKPHQKEEVVRVAIIAGAATLGAVYGLVTSRQMSELFRRKEKKNNEEKSSQLA